MTHEILKYRLKNLKKVYITQHIQKKAQMEKFFTKVETDLQLWFLKIKTVFKVHFCCLKKMLGRNICLI